MNVSQLYKQYPTREACLKQLEKVRWHNRPQCPYCNSFRVTAMLLEGRFHCNSCNTSFSVTVHTIFHNTKVDLQLWFMAIILILGFKEAISARKLAGEIGVNKNTAWLMANRIRKSLPDTNNFLQDLVGDIEKYLDAARLNNLKEVEQ